MKNLHLLSVAAAILPAAFTLSCAKQELPASGHPNIIYILADDMGYGDIAALNDSSKISTPNLDRLVSEGIYFTDAHSPSAVCTPTRYGILTGRYSFRTRLKSGVLWGFSPSLIENGRLTVASLLHDQGYVTGCVGKWHLGLDWAKKDPDKPLVEGKMNSPEITDNVDYRTKIHDSPNDHGFDYSYIIPASLDMQPYCYIENGKVVNPVMERIEGVREGRGLFWRFGDASKGFDFYQVLPHLASKSEGFIRGHAHTPGSPFFLYFPLTAPHTPWVPTEAFRGKSGAGDYGDFVVEVDHTVGQILDLVDSLGIAQNTLIIFTSDNGSHWKPEDIAEWDHRANYIYRGMKSDAWDGGHHIPYIVRWPEKVKAGSSSDQLVCLTDLTATCAELTGAPLPWSAAEDSYSTLGAMTGEKSTYPRRQDAIHHSISGMFAIRKGPWKFIDGRGSGGWSSKGKPTDPPGQLYNMKEDPSETHNLYNDYPEKVNELKGILEMYKREERSRYYSTNTEN